MNNPNLDRKTIWFAPGVWRALNSLMKIKGDDSPSLTVERLIKDAHAQALGTSPKAAR